MTDGLSDFFVDRAEPSVGFGLELALEADEPLQNSNKSWPLLLLERVADEVAEHERVREKVKTGFMSMEVSGKGMPPSLVTQEGRVGVLLSMESGSLPLDFSMPAGKVRLVTVKEPNTSQFQGVYRRDRGHVEGEGRSGGAEEGRRRGPPEP